MITLQIASTDRTKLIDWQSLKITNVLTKQADTCEFDILKYGDRTFKPATGQDVKVYDGATLIFGGIIVKVEETADSVRVIRYRVYCSDYTRLLDRRLVADTYQNKKIEDIIAEIITDYELDTDESITITNVNCDIVADNVVFNYEPVSKCIQQLAELVNYDWYIDYAKDIHFFKSENVPAPFNLTDAGTNHDPLSLVIRKDKSQVRNAIIVRGGEYLADTVTAELLADGEQIIFPTNYKLSDIKVTVTAEVQNTGLDYLDDPNVHDCLYNFQEKIVRFREDNKPTINSSVRISGRPYIPVIIDYRDDAAIASMVDEEGGSGIYEYLIKDKSIVSKEAARDRALAELYAYKNTLSEGEFKTAVSGLIAGQNINVQSDIRALNENFIINRVISRMMTPQQMEYSVNLVTTKTMGIIEFLQKLILRDRKEIVIDADEVVDKVKSISEGISIAEVIARVTEKEDSQTVTLAEQVRQNPFNPPDWCLAYWSVTGESDTKRHGYLDRSMYLY